MVQHQASRECGCDSSAEDTKFGFVQHLGSLVPKMSGIAEGSNEHRDGEADAAEHADTGEGAPVGSLRHLAPAQLDAQPRETENTSELAYQQTEEYAEGHTIEQTHK